MPLYEYKCTQCKRHTEKIQKFSDAEITDCPYCGGLLERVVSAHQREPTHRFAAMVLDFDRFKTLTTVSATAPVTSC